jgi:hypothetical protein
MDMRETERDNIMRERERDNVLRERDRDNVPHGPTRLALLARQVFRHSREGRHPMRREVPAEQHQEEGGR